MPKTTSRAGGRATAGTRSLPARGRALSIVQHKQLSDSPVGVRAFRVLGGRLSLSGRVCPTPAPGFTGDRAFCSCFEISGPDWAQLREQESCKSSHPELPGSEVGLLGVGWGFPHTLRAQDTRTPVKMRAFQPKTRIHARRYTDTREWARWRSQARDTCTHRTQSPARVPARTQTGAQLQEHRIAGKPHAVLRSPPPCAAAASCSLPPPGRPVARATWHRFPRALFWVVVSEFPSP